ncbi:MAG: HAMP domain-containing histidine kinase [Deltaproteobacteria bacterium]|nr:MAG: HAMP domain-containing histidine kinase [Deltaproteobacteria bacterium]
MMGVGGPRRRADHGATRRRPEDAALNRRKRRRFLPAGLLLAMLVGMVVIPTVLSATVGIVALALWREAFDIVFGVLILTFGATAIIGGTVAVGYVRRNARLAELQADFVANVSHELRTPVAGIRLVAETLEAGRGDDPERLAVLTEMLGDEVRRLEDLVERVLAWRRIDSEAPPSPHEPMRIEPLVREAVEGISRLPEARGATFEVEIAAALPPLLGDYEMLLHAVRNLVHNAVKFGGERGPVRIAVALEDDQLVLRVADDGPGIAPQELRHIFERFYRGRGGRGQVRGTGLGLDIVKNVVEEHGGRVGVQSALGRGATFTMSLPVSPGPGHG